MSLHLVGGSRVPNGITSGWNQVRMGSGEPIRVLFCFAALMENIPRKIYIYHMTWRTLQDYDRL